MRWLLRHPTGLLLNAATGLLAWPLLVVLAGRAVLKLGLDRPRVFRELTAFQRTWAGRVLGREIGASDRRDRELTWLAVHAVVGPACLIVPAGLPYFANSVLHLRVVEPTRLVTITLSAAIVALIAIGAASIPLLNGMQARLAERLLQPASSLRARVTELARSRAAAVDAQATELRRIERDLHDGAQARLIAVRMSLGLAKNSTDPDQVRELLQEAWDSAGLALQDLRALVRGIHPPVLSDRGLPGAIQAAALLCPVPVDVDVELPARPEAPVESAMYFAAAEALTNIAKHSDASRAWIRLRHSSGVLRLRVGDDGRGGADPAAGTGLAGMRRRLSAFDGTLAVRSPAGGPTELTMELPCALSSPKISHS
ncbi:Signal transduction histidine kinase [Saccharopolyspora kobensis]|uniref:histidine kinase n=1 Tax=Saccharopolyspora kobensis TaxID=146035 RepID=A0A1H6ECL4_9PSEU|nr:histidine kinase [Saccharopolyspora kobensis]SEG95517.1 Signal transduction histidine kinase [Saccharopolyspora kobensis]SFD55495.1 Signal transduction histidine kinase [Saccharopolyspora kobensis]